MAAARSSIRNLSAGATLQPLEQHGTDYQIPAPRNDDRNPHVNQGLPQNNTTNYSPFTTTDVQIYYPLESVMQYPVQDFAVPMLQTN